MPVFTNVFEIITQATSPPSSGGTRNVWNVYHYRLLSGAPDTPSQILGQWESTVGSFVYPQLSADYTGVAIIGRFLDDATAQYATIGFPVVGGVALPRLPDPVAIVLPLRCAQRGRSFRGSKHYGPVPTASVVKDELTAGALTAWGVIAGKLQGTFNSTNGSVYGPIVYSRTLSQPRVNPTTLVGSDVTSVLINKTIGTMRRRKEKTAR